jgi:hypothetical protein
MTEETLYVNETPMSIYTYNIEISSLHQNVGAKTHARKKHNNPTCVAENKNGTPCRNRSRHTIYCNKHVCAAMSNIVRIQKWWRKTRISKDLKKRGPALEARDICNNLEDFFTFTDVKDIPSKYFVSYYEKETKKVWGFDLRSISNLFQSRSFQNPYTRLEFDTEFVSNACSLIGGLKNQPDFVISDDHTEYLSPEERVKKECLNCFLDINSLGYHVDYLWMCNLSRSRLLRLYYDFQDIVMYRSYLTRTQIQEMFGILYPFSEIVYGLENRSHTELIQIICQKLKMILCVNSSNKELGILLFLTALTSASPEAFSSLCFLQQNF